MTKEEFTSKINYKIYKFFVTFNSGIKKKVLVKVLEDVPVYYVWYEAIKRCEKDYAMPIHELCLIDEEFEEV